MSKDEMAVGGKVTIDYSAMKAALDSAAAIAYQIQARSRNHEQEILAARLATVIEKAQTALGEAEV